MAKPVDKARLHEGVTGERRGHAGFSNPVEGKAEVAVIRLPEATEIRCAKDTLGQAPTLRSNHERAGLD